MIVERLYNRSYKIADHIGVRAQLINSDHLKFYQKREESQVVIEEYIRKEELSNSRQ